jgi:hypothetical protein
LAALAGLDQARGNPIAMQVVKRGHRVVEDDRRLRVDRRQLGEEGGERDAAMLACAQNLTDGSVGLSIRRTWKKGTPAVVFAC